MPLKAKRCGHRAVAIPIVPARGLVTLRRANSARDRSSQISRITSPSSAGAAAGPFSHSLRGAFQGWSLAELAVLNRYRKRAW